MKAKDERTVTTDKLLRKELGAKQEILSVVKENSVPVRANLFYYTEINTN